MDYIIIDSLSSLEYVYLRFNSVKEIKFKNLYALKELELESDVNFDIQTDLFDQLPNIEKLSYKNLLTKFEFNKLDKSIIITQAKKSFNFDLFINEYCNELEIFEIRESSIENITWLLSNYYFPNLLLLTISCCDFTRVEKKWFDSLQPMIPQLKLNFNYNLQKIDPDVFSNLKQLVSLDLSYNIIETLDRRLFSSLINLESLYLNNNHLKTLEGNIFSDLMNLKKLDLYYNKLEALNVNSFVGLENNLKELDLNNNRLEIINRDVFSNLKQLVSLNFCNNSIESLDKRPFFGLINLETLIISCNRIKRLDDYIFSNLKNLKLLSLWENDLKCLDVKSFVGLDNLNQLNLSKNKFTFFDVRIMDNLPRIERIYLSLNAIKNKDEISNLFIGNDFFRF